MSWVLEHLNPVIYIKYTGQILSAPISNTCHPAFDVCTSLQAEDRIAEDLLAH